MPKKIRYAGDDDDDDIVKDGEALRVPLYMMDSQQRAVAAETASSRRLLDAYGQPGGYGAGYGFGIGIVSDADAAKAQEARDVYIDRISNAWKGPQNVGSAPVKDAFDTADAPTLADARAAADAAWLERNERISNAWRGTGR